MTDEKGKSGQICQKSIPLADGWCLRDSKSMPGRKYYFNTVTKQSIWHIPDNEIKILEQKTNITKDQPTSTKPNNPLPKKIEGTNINSTINDNIINPINLLNGRLPYDPSMCAVPYNPPGVSIVVDNLCNPLIPPPTQTAFIITQNTMQSTTPYDTNQMPNINRYTPNVVNNSYTSSRKQRVFSRKFTNLQHSRGDLRNELRNGGLNTYEASSSQSNNQHNFIENITSDDDKIRNVLLFLSGKAKPNTKQDTWYVVPDVSVIEKYSSSLNKMKSLDTNKKCCLKIPPFVMKELTEIAHKPGNESIRRFIRFCCTDTISESLAEDENDEISSIRATCKKLIEDNYHVVALCRQQLFHNLKQSLNTPVFTMPKIFKLANGYVRNRWSRNLTIPGQPAVQASTSSDIKNKNNRFFSGAVENSHKTDFVCPLLDEAQQTDLQDYEENVISMTNLNESEISVQRTKIDSREEKCDTSDNFSLPTQKQDFSNTPKKRLIKLKPTTDERHVTDQSLKKRRWNINKDRGKVCETVQSVQKNEETNETHQIPNVSKESNIENEKSVIINQPEEQDVDCKYVPSETMVNEPSLIAESNVECNNDELVISDYEDKSSIVPTTTYIHLIEHKPVDGSEFGSSFKWMPRFTKIMVNVLLQVLHNKTPISMEVSPKIECLRKVTLEVIKKYSHYCYIVDAANKLSMKLTQLIKTKDVTNLNQTNFQDTDIYYRGANLVDTLQEIGHSLEHIQNAKTLLKNLLDDSHKPELHDNQQQGTSSDDQQNTEAAIIIMDTSTKEPGTKSMEENCNRIECNEDNIRAKKRKFDEIAEDQCLGSLKLQKIDCVPPKIISHDDTGVTALRDGGMNIDSEAQNYVDVTNTKDVIDNNNSIEDKNMDGEYYQEVEQPLSINTENEISDTARRKNIDNEKFKFFIGVFLKEIRDNLLVCIQSFDASLTQEKYNEACSLLSKTCEFLDSILRRESGDVNNNFKSLLNIAGFDCDIDKNMYEEYRVLIHKCKVEYEACLEVFQSMIT